MAEERPEFSERVSSVFGSLNSTLKSFTDSPLKQEPVEDLRERQFSRESRDARHPSRSRDRSPHRRHHIEHRRSKRPARVPDHVRNPRKWTKYDLSDDGTNNSEYEGLNSDQLNRRAAFEFLHQLRGKELESCDQETPPSGSRDGEKSQVTFKPKRQGISHDVKQGPIHRGPGDQTDKAHYQSGVLRMPEYVVGSKQQRKHPLAKKTLSGGSEELNRTSTSTSSVRLSHLDTQEEDEEEGE